MYSQHLYDETEHQNLQSRRTAHTNQNRALGARQAHTSVFTANKTKTSAEPFEHVSANKLKDYMPQYTARKHYWLWLQGQAQNNGGLEGQEGPKQVA